MKGNAVKERSSKNSRTMGSSEDGGSFTNISVEEHYSVSQSSPGGQFVGPTEELSTAAEALIGRSTTLTEALKAAAMNVGHKPVETTDVAAIKEVETRAIGDNIEGDRGGVTAVASEAVARNEKIGKKDEKTNLRDVIAETDVKVTRDKSVTSEDAEAVVQAELNHSPLNHIIPGGVAESVAAAYKLNRNPSL
ncbi:PREDICTED: late embryogenesis abundant protein 49-like [Camelina sativa]|uniref:Late embryogenesis abundant protein 49-like n=1 Tax=Camelina sativa TaxID=90675 RepID=A0ABM0USQ5_CAMSA|nr:PREDICTED: late embryogenesis abundant protein 49-like [Camelina sativa]